MLLQIYYFGPLDVNIFAFFQQNRLPGNDLTACFVGDYVDDPLFNNHLVGV
jgi:hypothetical protein